MSVNTKKICTGKAYSDLPHVLVVDDDKRIRDLVSRYLSEHDFVVSAAESANQARQILDVLSFDGLIVDVMMPEETGLEFVQDLRRDKDIPVLFLTALGEIDDRLSGFEAGGDDYLPKPFEPKELVMRLHAILRRRMSVQRTSAVFRIGVWRYTTEQAILVNDAGEEIRLTTVEETLLRALCQKNGTVVTRDELAEMCDIDSSERTIDVQVTRLRRKIEEDTKNPRYLQTVRGKGYLLRAEVV